MTIKKYEALKNQIEDLETMIYRIDQLIKKIKQGDYDYWDDDVREIVLKKLREEQESSINKIKDIKNILKPLKKII